MAGDTHNFGRRVTIRGRLVHKPRTLAWEKLFLSARSPLRKIVPLELLPTLRFRGSHVVQRIALDRLPRRFDPVTLARIGGRSLALWSFFGVTDLHWENMVLGMGPRGPVFAPIDIEMVLEDFSTPAQTRLIPEQEEDPVYARLYRHACGIRRLLPWIGKPLRKGIVDAIVDAYDEMFALLDDRADAIGEVLAGLRIGRIPIRVTLRSTAEYASYASYASSANEDGDDIDFLDAEREQLERGDIPYFFRLYGRPGIHWFADARLRTVKTMPVDLAPLLPLDFRTRARKKLRDGGGDAIRRALRTVNRVNLPCTCGETRSVLARPSSLHRGHEA